MEQRQGLLQLHPVDVLSCWKKHIYLLQVSTPCHRKYSQWENRKRVASLAVLLSTFASSAAAILVPLKLTLGFQNKPPTARVPPVTWWHVAGYSGRKTYLLVLNKVFIVTYFYRVWCLLQNILKPLLLCQLLPLFHNMWAMELWMQPQKFCYVHYHQLRYGPLCRNAHNMLRG